MRKKQPVPTTVKVTANVPRKLHRRIRKDVGKRGMGPLIVQMLAKKYA